MNLYLLIESSNKHKYKLQNSMYRMILLDDNTLMPNISRVRDTFEDLIKYEI